MLQVTSKQMPLYDISPKNRNINHFKSPTSKNQASSQKETNYLPLKNFILKTKRMKPMNSSFRNIPLQKSLIKESDSSNPLEFLQVGVDIFVILIMNR